MYRSEFSPVGRPKASMARRAEQPPCLDPVSSHAPPHVSGALDGHRTDRAPLLDDGRVVHNCKMLQMFDSRPPALVSLTCAQRDLPPRHGGGLARPRVSTAEGRALIPAEEHSDNAGYR